MDAVARQHGVAHSRRSLEGLHGPRQFRGAHRQDDAGEFLLHLVGSVAVEQAPAVHQAHAVAALRFVQIGSGD